MLLFGKIDSKRCPANGVHNKIFFSHDNRTVLRVSGKDDEDEQNQLKRGNEVLQYISQLQSCLGPLAVKLVHELQKVEEVPEFITFEETFDSYWVSEIENLGAQTLQDDFPAGDREIKFVVACLIWYFSVMRAEIGFVHRDLHMANLMWRDLPKPVTIAFNQTLFFTQITRVPVVIDFDFSLTHTTPDEDRGIFHGAPRVASVEDLFAAFDEIDPKVSEATDWHAIGCLFATCIYGGGQWSSLKCINYAAHARYRDNIPESLDRKSYFVKTAIDVIPALCILNHTLGNETFPPPHLYERKDYYEAFFSPKQRLIIQEVIDEGDSTFVLNNINARYLLRRMLSWDPQERIMYGETIKYLDFAYFNSARFKTSADISLTYDFRKNKDTV